MKPAVSDTAVIPADGIFTQLGGILYLINVIMQLDILANCMADEGFANQIGAWGVLALLACGLLDPMPELLQDDPIWTVLAELDGRSPHQPPILNCPLPVTEIRAHLLDLLHLDNSGDLVETLLLVNGCLYTTTTHVDLIVHLEEVSLPVRLAGLDFDPGWQPAFGRVIQFHFT